MELARTESGKPFFANSDRVHFSISHSRDHVACALSEGGIGVDLEDVSRDFSGVVGHLLSRRELARYRELPPVDRNRFACAVWTLKEALGKYRGCGLGYDLRSVSFAFPDRPCDGMATFSGETGERPLFFRTLPVAGRYLLSVCCEEPTHLTWGYESPEELLEAGGGGPSW